MQARNNPNKEAMRICSSSTWVELEQTNSLLDATPDNNCTERVCYFQQLLALTLPAATCPHPHGAPSLPFRQLSLPILLRTQAWQPSCQICLAAERDTGLWQSMSAVNP